MSSIYCQEEALKNIKELQNNLLYIVGRPYKEDYYYYSINNFENYKIINKYTLKGIIMELVSKDAITIEYVFNKFRNFIYIHETNTFLEIKPDESRNIESIIAQELNRKELFTKGKQDNDKKSRYENIMDSLKLKLKINQKKQF